MKRSLTWKALIILSVIAGAATGLINCIEVLQDTSFTVPAVTPELWLVLALWIVMKAENVKDAMAKTFVFFLISQPLVYLVEVPFKAMGWGLFSYYPYWGMMTVLTIPCAYLAWQVKKGNVLSALILSIGSGYLGYSILYYGRHTLSSFPQYLLHDVFCAVSAVLMILILLKGKKERIIAFGMTAIITGVLGFRTLVSSAPVSGVIEPEPYHQWRLIEVNDDIRGTWVNGRFEFETTIRGTTLVNLVNEKGQVVT